MIVHLPHASDFIPPAYRQLFVLDKESLRQELLRMTDWYTDLLFSGVGVPLRFPISRLVCDVERFRDPAQEPMAAQGMWICYTRTSSLEALKQWDVSHVQQILSRYYDPHHRNLSALVAQELSQTGRALIVDGHPFPTSAIHCGRISALAPTRFTRRRPYSIGPSTILRKEDTASLSIGLFPAPLFPLHIWDASGPYTAS